MLFSSSSSSISSSSSNADDDVFLPAMIPSWAQAKTEMDLKADANYAARGGVGQTTTTTTMKTKRAQQYVNFERLLFSSKRRKAKRTPTKTCAVRRLDDDDDDDDDDEIQREAFERRRTTKQLGIVIVVCLENISEFRLRDDERIRVRKMCATPRVRRSRGGEDAMRNGYSLEVNAKAKLENARRVVRSYCVEVRRSTRAVFDVSKGRV